MFSMELSQHGENPGWQEAPVNSEKSFEVRQSQATDPVLWAVSKGK